MLQNLIIKEDHKRKCMKITSMRSLLILLLVCLLVAGTVTAFTNITASDSIYYKEMVGGVSCADHSVPGLQGESLIAVVELSGHGDLFIDGTNVEPDRTGTYQEHVTSYYRISPGPHTVIISMPGYTNYIAQRTICSGKVTYEIYDQEAHLFQGTTRTAATTPAVPATTITVVPETTNPAGQSADYGSLKSALGTSGSSGNPGTLSVTTDPAGATIYIDGIKQGISPATIPGLNPGSHTLLLKLDGYDDLSLPVTISAGKTQNYSSALMKSGGSGAAAATVPATRKSSAPGFAGITAACVIGALLCLRKTTH
jgi:hypothetical protein